MASRAVITVVLSGLVATTLGVVATPVTQAVPIAPPVVPELPPLDFVSVGTYDTGLASGDGDITAAEIVAYEAGKVYVVNTSSATLDVLAVGVGGELTLDRRVDLAAYGPTANSVAVERGVIAVALDAAVRTDPGTVVLLNSSLRILTSLRVGAGPDMVTFTPDGSKLLVANEGEPSDDYTIDPEGSISIISTRFPSLFDVLPPSLQQRLLVRQVGFRGVRLPAGVRNYGPSPSARAGLEPEYITTSADGRTAYVSLQENNAMAIVDTTLGFVRKVIPLGTKDHSIPGNGLDASDRDNAINIANWPVRGLYQPDAMASFEHGGKTYLVLANEGDTRDYAGFSEEVRLSDVPAGQFDLARFPDLATLRQNALLGRLTITTATADLDGDGFIDEIQVPGARSFSIRVADTASLVYDSGDQIEQIVAESEPDFFNASNDSNAFDNRSDNKGPEPEGVAVGEIDGRRYSFVALERQGGFLVHDITDPAAPVFVTWANNRDYTTGDIVGPDSGPEGITFVPASDSPTGSAIVLVGNEVSGTVTAWSPVDPDGAGTLTLLHNNDGESSLLPLSYSRPTGVTTGPSRVAIAGVSAFSAVTDREIASARSDRNSIVNVYAGDAFLASATLQCSFDPAEPVYDAVAQRLIPYDAHVFGNHEFDYTPAFLERFVREFDVDGDGSPDQPFLSSNLDFDAEPGFDDLVETDGLIVGETEAGRVVARSSVVTDESTRQRFGIVGATTPDLPIISSPRDVTVTPDLAATAAAVQAEIDRLTGLGITKIILVSHLQNLANDRQLVELLRDVDIAVAGGGDEFLGDTADRLPYETQTVAGTYPLTQIDAEGENVSIVTTAGNYKYLGRLDVTFDAAGEVASIDEAMSRPVRVLPQSAEAALLGATDQVAPDPEIESQVIAPVNECLTDLEATPVAGSEVVIDTSNAAQRTREGNAGNLVTDGFVDTYLNYAATNGLGVRAGTNRVAGLTNGGGIRQNAGNSLPNDGGLPGILSRLDVINVLPFDNFLVVVDDVPAATLQATFDFAAQGLGAGLTSEDLPLPVVSNGRFLQVSGFEVEYRRTKSAALNDVKTLRYTGDQTTPNDDVDLVVNGELVANAPAIDVVTNSFTASGGDGYTALGALPAIRLRDTTGGLISYEQAWREYLRTFPPSTVAGVPNLPTIPANDTRYSAITGEGRITIVPTP